MKNPFSGANRRRLTAALGAASLALLGLAAFAGPAHADTNGGNVPPGPYTLTLTKLETPPGGGSATNGTRQTPPGAVPIPGVTYTIAPVNGVDLSTSSGWDTASRLAVNSSGAVTDGTSTFTTGAATPLTTTDANGVTTYTTPTAGVYKVTETSAPAGYELAAPFLVALPLPQSGNWLTDVFVYPKNTLQGAPVKTVDDGRAHAVGDTITWTVTSTVPNQAAGNPFTVYRLTDTLDARLTPPAVADVTVSLADSAGTAIALPAADRTVTVTNQTVTVSFTASGLALLTANPSAVITVTIPTVVNAAGDGTIRNTALQSTRSKNQEDAGDPETDTPTPPVQVTFGSVTIHKTDPGLNDLQGAEFQVYASAADATSGTNPIPVGGSTTFTTDGSGRIVIDSLKAQNNGAGANLTYYVVETKAPAGYQIAAGFRASDGGYAVTVAPGNANLTLEIVDPQTPPIALPLTGSTGTAIFVTGGIALVAGALAAAVLLARRRRHPVVAEAVTGDATPQ